MSRTKNNRGTTVCILEENNNTESRIYAAHDTPGSNQDQSPCMSELTCSKSMWDVASNLPKISKIDSSVT